MKVDLVQGSKEWLNARKKHVMASDAPVIMEVSPWRTPYQLWQDKLGLGEEIKDNPGMRRGREIEPIARALYEDLVGVKMEPSVVFSDNVEWLGASMDGLSVDGKRGLEIKYANREDHELAKKGKVPSKYIPQVQQQWQVNQGMEVLNYMSIRSEDDYHMFEVDMDEGYIKEMFEKQEEFWYCVKNLKEPKMTEKDKKTLFLNMQSDSWFNASMDWLRLKSEVDEGKKKQEACRQKLLALCDGKDALGFGIQVKSFVKAGSVDYSKVPELEGVDLDRYRKDSTIVSRITTIK